MARIARQCCVLCRRLRPALLALLLLAGPAKAWAQYDLTCEQGLSALVATGRWPMPEWSGTPQKIGYQAWWHLRGTPAFWFIGKDPEVYACVDRLLLELRVRADAGDRHATHVLGAFLPILFHGFSYFQTISEPMYEARREGHERLRIAAEAGDTLALWLLWNAYYAPVLFLAKYCVGDRIDVPPIVPLLAWLEQQGESNDPALLLQLERVAIQGRCIAADPYRAIRYRERWQALTGSADELCKGDLARCNYRLDYHGPHLWQR